MLTCNATEAKLMVTLFKKLEKESEEDSYLYKLAKELNRSMPATLESLRKLKKKGIVQSRPSNVPMRTRGPRRYYYLTDYGKCLAYTMLYAEQAVQIFRKQGII